MRTLITLIEYSKFLKNNLILSISVLLIPQLEVLAMDENMAEISLGLFEFL